MLRQHKTAVVPKRNMLGKLVRRRITLADVIQRGLDFDKEELLDLLDRGHMLPLIAGGTTPSNSVAQGAIYFPRAIVVSSDQTINQGDLVYWDGVVFTLKPLTDPSDVLVVAGGSHGYCGAAQGTSNPGVYPNPPAGTPSESLPGVVVQRGGSVYCNSTTGDGTYFPFEPVTVGADAQTVTRGGVVATNRVGYVIVPPPVNARGAAAATPVPETVAGGSRVELWLEPKFPVSALL